MDENLMQQHDNTPNPATPSVVTPRAKTPRERRAELAARRDALNAQLRRMDAQISAQERKDRAHRLIVFGAEFEEQIAAAVEGLTRKDADEKITALARKYRRALRDAGVL